MSNTNSKSNELNKSEKKGNPSLSIYYTFSLSLTGFIAVIVLLAGLISNVFGSTITFILAGLALVCAASSLTLSITGFFKEKKDRSLTIMSIMLSTIYIVIFLVIFIILSF